MPVIVLTFLCPFVLKVNGAASTVQQVPESVGPVYVDPRSPTVGIVRTPLKDSMKSKLTW